MHNNKNRLAYPLATALVLVMALLCGTPFAQSLGLNKTADISFGTVDFTNTTIAGDITLATNGTVTYTPNTSGNGFGTPAQLEIQGTPGVTVSIACSTQGTMALPGTGTLNVTPVNFIIGAANATVYAGGTDCLGFATTVATHTLTATASENTIFAGGTLNTNGQTLHSGTFSSANSGGSQPAFRVLVQ